MHKIKCASSKIYNIEGEAVFINSAQTVDMPIETGLVYDQWATEECFYAYVLRDPVSFVDPFGLKLCQADLPNTQPGVNPYLDDDFYPNVVDWLELNQADGINVQITDAFRTTGDQTKRRNNPASTTPAKPGNSLHEAGWAIDVNFNAGSFSDNDRINILSNAMDAGLSWGGDFSKSDPVHFYQDPGNRNKRIKQAQEDFANGKANECKCGP